MRRLLLAALLHADRLHLLWALREIDQRRAAVAYIQARIATNEVKLQALRPLPLHPLPDQQRKPLAHLLAHLRRFFLKA